MNERPILMSRPMVQAILAGTKAQTRRLTKSGRFPLGWPGDRLWVRETYAIPPGSTSPKDVVYRADVEDLKEEESIRRLVRRKHVPWRPSIHMPRWASRILLEVTNTRSQRLQDINAYDSIAEGIPEVPRCGCEVCRMTSGMCTANAGEQIRQFAELWNATCGQLHGCSWADNPWVWAISFRRLQP